MKKFELGQLITAGKPDSSYYVVWEVVDPDMNNLSIKVIRCVCKHWSKYIDEGKTYILKPLNALLEKDGRFTHWEIPPEQMKRNVSQALLQWFDNQDEPSFDLDS